MKSLTKLKVSEWIKQTQQIEDPHHNPELADRLLHAQFYAPKDYWTIKKFTSEFVDEIVVSGD